MLKPKQLQQRLIEQIPELGAHPEILKVNAGPGSVVATLAPSLSFEYHYPLTLVATTADLSESLVDHIVVEVLDWLTLNQPEVMSNSARRLTDFTFTQLADTLTLTLQLTERVQVKDADGVRTITHLPEPPLPENNARPHQVYLNGELISQWAE